MFIQSYAPEIIHFIQSRNRIKLLNKQLSIQLPECENINIIKLNCNSNNIRTLKVHIITPIGAKKILCLECNKITFVEQKQKNNYSTEGQHVNK